jgi:eukaryotic-like serine/threonine-protein kinase
MQPRWDPYQVRQLMMGTLLFTTVLHSIEGLAWSPEGKEVWFAGDKSGAGWADELIALSTSGKLRDLLRLPGITRLHDIFRDGRVLLSKESFGIELFSGGSGLARESDLSWLDTTSLSDMSTDGKTVVFEEGGDTESGAGFDLYLRRTDGTPPVKLGSGTNGVLSPNGQWVLAVSGTPDALILLPSGVGEPRTIDNHGIRGYLAPGWFADGKRIVFAGNEGDGWHMYVQEISGGKPTAVTLVINRPGTYENRPLSPGGHFIWARDLNQKAWLYPVDGGDQPQWLIWVHKMSGSEGEMKARPMWPAALASRFRSSAWILRQANEQRYTRLRPQTVQAFLR